MQLVLHAGAHFTEEERLLRCLLRNADALKGRGVAVPGPGRYRRLLKKTLAALQDAPPAPDARDILFDMILDDDSADRIILSHMFLFGAPHASVRNGKIYEAAPNRMAKLSSLFSHDEVELVLCMRDPAIYLPSCFEIAPQADMQGFLRGFDPFQIKWSDTLLAIREAAPAVNITAFCFEDLPLIWAEVIRDIAGLDHAEDIIGEYDLLEQIMSNEGMERFHAYIAARPTLTEIQKRRVIAAFLDKFAIDDAIEEELNAPGWSEDDIEELSVLYEEDMHVVARIPGVTFIGP